MENAANIPAKYTAYARDCVNGRVVCCEYVKQAAGRYLALLQDDRYYFRANLVEKVIKFISRLKHYEGKTAGRPFTLQPFQVFIIANIYGLWCVQDNTRLTTKVYIEMARKQGKSFLMSAIALFELLCMGEAAQQVQIVANSYRQGQLLFKMAQTLSKQLDPKGRHFKQYRDSIQLPRLNSYLEVLSSDASKADGKNSGCFIVDEYHEAKSDAMYNVLLSSQGARSTPLAVIITTAGFDLFSPCYKQRQTATEILAGVKTDDSLFALIYTLDEGDDYADPETWIKANPNLNVTVSGKFLSEQVNNAKNNPSLEVGVKTKNFNIWCNAAETWINQDELLRASQPVNLAEFSGGEYTCYCGVDLAAVSDLTAVSVLVETGQRYYFKTWYFLPSATVESSPNSAIYKEWQRRGLLNVTEGNVTDYDAVLRLLLQVNEVVPINAVAYDKWNATQWAISATEAGLPLQPYSQAVGNFSTPTKAFERLLLNGQVVLDDNEITRYCFSNVVLKADWNDNVKPVKTNPQNKIDGTISIIEALGVYIQGYGSTAEIFTA